ncbi:hypothetical protein [Acinetobacter baumannii]
MDKSINELYKEHVGLINKVTSNILKRVANMQNAGMQVPIDLQDAEDIHNILFEVFVKAINGFDEKQNFRFSTYFVKAAYNRINRIIESAVGDRSINTVSFFDLANNDEGEPVDADRFLDVEQENSFEQADLSNVLNYVQTQLSPLALELLKQVIHPHPEFEREYEAQYAKREFALQFHSSHYKAMVKPLNLAFIVRCVKRTATTNREQVLVDEAAKEIRKLLSNELM